MSTLAPELSPGEVLPAMSKKSGLGLRRGVWQLGLKLALSSSRHSTGYSLAHIATAAFETVGA